MTRSNRPSPLNQRWSDLVAALLLSLLVLPVAATAQTAQEMEAAPADSDAAMAEMMAAWQEAATPGPHHRHLDRLVGDWTGTATMWMAPGAPPMESQFEITAAWTLDGRYVDSTLTGQMMGGQFEGRSIDGYDNITDEYFTIWRDNMSTGIMMMTGTCETESCDAIVYTGEMPDPVSGEMVGHKMRMSYPDADTYKIESWEMKGDGERKQMEMVAKKKGAEMKKRSE